MVAYAKITLGTQMKATGEVMAMECFEQAMIFIPLSWE